MRGGESGKEGKGNHSGKIRHKQAAAEVPRHSRASAASPAAATGPGRTGRRQEGAEAAAPPAVTPHGVTPTPAGPARPGPARPGTALPAPARPLSREAATFAVALPSVARRPLPLSPADTRLQIMEAAMAEPLRPQVPLPARMR